MSNEFITTALKKWNKFKMKVEVYWDFLRKI
jgi:hypothetical protein